jgi:CMP-N,N'-diacetyllegionaminic acid synthase
MRVLGIIPARGGSKVVPRKNVRLLGGKPLLSYMIEAALKSKINRTIVSTEDKEIAAIAREWGAEVPFIRPKELATDTASSLSVLLHALRYVEEKERYSPDAIAFLQPTAPFCTWKRINAALEMLSSSDVDSVVGVCESEFHPYFMYEMDRENNLREIIKVKDKPLRRQDVPPMFRLTDAPIISRRRYYDKVTARSPCFNPKSMKGLVMDRISAIDINDEFDFLLAEVVIKSGLFKPR